MNDVTIALCSTLWITKFRLHIIHSHLAISKDIISTFHSDRLEHIVQGITLTNQKYRVHRKSKSYSGIEKYGLGLWSTLQPVAISKLYCMVGK